MKSTFISWTRYTKRVDVLARELGATPYFVSFLRRSTATALPRYVLQSIATWRILWRERPEVVLAMNPPIFCPLVVWLYARLSGARYILDSHTGAFADRKWRIWTFLHRFLARRALLNIVTTEFLSNLERSWGAASMILAEFFPVDWVSEENVQPLPGYNVAVITTFSPDEPIGEIIEAGRLVSGVTLHLTGDPSRARRELVKSAPEDVRFTGFLSEKEYVRLLKGVDAVMDLTTDNHTMLSGAFEALWLGKPLILSDWGVLRSYFDRGTVYVQNSRQGIAEGIQSMHHEKTKLIEEIRALRVQRYAEWKERIDRLKRIICGSYRTADMTGHGLSATVGKERKG